MFSDSHFHLSIDNCDMLIEDSIKNSVSLLIASVCEKEEFSFMLNLLSKYPELYATFGYHPDSVSSLLDSDLDLLKDLIINNDKVVGIGEIGLDYHYNDVDKDLQILWFRKQLELAVSLNVPVVIHSRDATFDTISILKEYKVRGIIHCFMGSYETALEYVSLGFLLGIGGVLTFKNSKLGENIKNITLNNIVLETDSPYLSPIRGEENFPRNVIIVAKYLSSLYNVSENEIAKITTKNVRNLFDI